MGSKVVQQPEGETVRQPEGEVVRQTKFFQSTQPTPNSIRDRSGRPDNMQDGGNTSRSEEISVKSCNEEPSSSDRTGRLVKTEEIQACSSEDSKSLNLEQTHDRTGRLVTDTAAVQDDSQVYHEANTLNIDDEVLRERMEKSIVVHDENHEPMMVNEADMNFKIPGPPHSVVKHAQRTSVRQLIQKIENHPNRHALQQDLRQNQSFNFFSPESKQMIRDVGNIELCELLETEPKMQCTVCLSYYVFSHIGAFEKTVHDHVEANLDSCVACGLKFGPLHLHISILLRGERQDDVRVDALWEALEMTVRSPEKHMDVGNAMLSNEDCFLQRHDD